MIQDILRQLLYLIAVEWNQLISHQGYGIYIELILVQYLFFSSYFILIGVEGQHLVLLDHLTKGCVSF